MSFTFCPLHCIWENMKASKWTYFPSANRLIEKPADSKSFYLNFRSKFFFISGISGPFPTSLFPFLHFTITGSFCWYDCGNGNENKKTQLFYLPCFWRMGRPRGNIHIFKCGPNETKHYIDWLMFSTNFISISLNQTLQELSLDVLSTTVVPLL